MPSFVAPSVRRALLAGAAVAAFGAFTAPGAHAAFTLKPCTGSGAVRGQGSSFQKDLQNDFSSFFSGFNGCQGLAGPTYSANGSGDGIASMGGGGGNATLFCATLAQGACTVPLVAGVRDPNTSFAGSDDPPSVAQKAAMEAGTASSSDDGIIHVIPIATGASAFIMHAPEGCNIGAVTNHTNLGDQAASGSTGDTAANHTQRIRISNVLLEKAFAGDNGAQTWGNIAPGISGTTTNPQEATGNPPVQMPCDQVPVKRIVRSDSSGTTFSWKTYLNLINGNRNWKTVYGSPNTVWPQKGGTGTATPTLENNAACPNTETNLLCAGNGGGGLADDVAATDGSIGYVDLATARAKGFDMTPDANQQVDYKFWSPLETNPGSANPTGTYAEPTSDPTAHSGGSGQKGANCVNAPITGVPTAASSPNLDPTRGDWSSISAAGGPAYPACVLTFALAWDDNAPVYGNTQTEEAKARTVKDYLSLIVSAVGQVKLASTDYSPLPSSLADIARTGVNAIDWNKAAGSGGGGGGTTTTPGGGTTTTPGGSTPVGPPSNVFSLPSHKLSSTLITYTLQVPGKGKLKIVATTKVGRKTITGASISTTVSGGGKVTVKLKLSAKARSALAHARGRKLKFIVKFTFTPTGGTARTVSKTVTLVAPKPKRR